MTKSYSKIELLKLLDDQAEELAKQSKESLMGSGSKETKKEEWEKHCELADNIRWASQWIADLPDVVNLIGRNRGEHGSDVSTWESGDRTTA